MCIRDRVRLARQADVAVHLPVARLVVTADARILGTNKKQGLLVYDLQGKQTQLLEVGRLNNVDGGKTSALAAARSTWLSPPSATTTA